MGGGSYPEGGRRTTGFSRGYRLGQLRSFPPGTEEGRAISALLDRAVETGALEGVLAAVRDGLSGVLMLRGEAGVGKTALLDWAAGQADEMQVARVAGAAGALDLGFAVV